MVARSGILCLAALLTNAAQTSRTLVISDVTVISPRHNRVEAHQNVVIEGERISAVVPASSRVPKEARIVRGEGRFLIPGLWDAHVHVTKAGILLLPLFVANGITGIRDMGSDLSEVSMWRSQITAGQLIGPHMKTSGQILESRSNVERMKREGTVEPVDRIRVGLADPDEARRAVDRLADAGADHIKMRSTADSQTFVAVAQEAQRRRLPLAVHPIASVEELMRARVRSVEHFLAYPPLNTLSGSERRALFRRMAKAGTNPVADIRNTKRIQAVSVRGRWLERTELDRLFRDVENSAKAGCRPLNAR